MTRCTGGEHGLPRRGALSDARSLDRARRADRDFLCERQPQGGARRHSGARSVAASAHAHRRRNPGDARAVTAERTYLDYNASAPLRPEAREAMLAALDLCGNPSSVHAEGRRARALVDAGARRGRGPRQCRPSEVVFTSGATEANTGRCRRAGSRSHFPASSTIPSARPPAHPVRASSRSRRPAIGVAVVERSTCGACSRRAAARRAHRSADGQQRDRRDCSPSAAGRCGSPSTARVVHTDAVQAPGRIAIDFRTLGASTMSLSSHKIGGPKGIGALVIRDGRSAQPAHHGRRPGASPPRRNRECGGDRRLRRRGARGRTARLADMDRVAALRDRLEARGSAR